MEPIKPWYKSKTIWGVIIMALSTIYSRFTHSNITPEQVQDFIKTVTDSIPEVGALVGGGLAIYGRLKAAVPIKGNSEIVRAAAADKTPGVE